MHSFALPLEKGEDAVTGLPVFGFTLNDMFIHDPRLSDCGRFEVDPQTAYGLSSEDVAELAKLNQLLDEATQAALNAGCRAIQDALGIPSGDVAGLFFSGTDTVKPVADQLADYILRERAMAAEDR